MNNNTILAIAFLIAGTLLTTIAVTTMVPAAYAERDGDNYNGMETNKKWKMNQQGQ